MKKAIIVALVLMASFSYARRPVEWHDGVNPNSSTISYAGQY